MAESDALHVAGAAPAGATVSAVTAPPAMTSAAASLSAVWVINVTPRGSVGASTHQAAGVRYSRVGHDFVAAGIHIEGPAQQPRRRSIPCTERCRLILPERRCQRAGKPLRPSDR